MKIRYAGIVIAALLGTAGRPVAGQVAARQVVATNNNRHAAGQSAGRRVTVQLVAGRGQWQPEGADGPALEIAAFGEDGGPLTNPGPLLRVSEGTELVVRVRNTLSARLDVHGLVTHPASADTIQSIPPGETREIAFAAGAAGTYHYWATTTGTTLAARTAADSQLGGAFIVDPAGVTPDDRVFVIAQWDERPRSDEGLVSPGGRRLFTINGLSWPHTERLDERVGRSATWRVVNLSLQSHPMHLHGFYFTVQSAGTGLQDTVYDREQSRTVVTENMLAGGTMRLTWTPERPGNWLFHCHLIGHVTPDLRFWKSDDAMDHGVHDAATAMAGLVMGIRVTGNSPVARVTSTASARKITLVMQRRPGYWEPEDAYGFAMKTGERDPAAEDVSVPGPLLVLKRDEAVEITLKNELPEATGIHWHGIELESRYDGVPGWSGMADSTTPAIQPGRSFVVRFTPPRAGTFIYHTHAHDGLELASGLYGAIVVLGPGETYDPERDHVLVIGMEGPKRVVAGRRVPIVINGSESLLLTLKPNEPNRLRLINITSNASGLNVSIIGLNGALMWQPVAKDGADLPASQRTPRPALKQTVSVGETYDFVIDPPSTGRTWIELRRANGEWVQQVAVRVAR